MEEKLIFYSVENRLMLKTIEIVTHIGSQMITLWKKVLTEKSYRENTSSKYHDKWKYIAKLKVKDSYHACKAAINGSQ